MNYANGNGYTDAGAISTLQQMTFRTNEWQFAQFTRGLRAVLHQWTALLLVAQHCDVDAVHNLEQDLLEWHQRDGEIYSDEMEVFFEDFFDFARAVSIEDDSMKEVADVLHDMYRRCCANDFSTVEEYVRNEIIYKRLNPLSQCINMTPSSAANLVISNNNFIDEAEAKADNYVGNNGNIRLETAIVSGNEEEEERELQESLHSCAVSRLPKTNKENLQEEEEEELEEEEWEHQQYLINDQHLGVTRNKKSESNIAPNETVGNNKADAHKRNARRRKNAYRKSEDG